MSWSGRKTAYTFAHPAREHVAEKLTGFADRNRLQLFDFEALLLARVIQPEHKRL